MPNPIPFDNTYAKLPERFYSRQEADSVPSPQLIRANTELAMELDIDPSWLESEEAVDVFSGTAVAEGSEPLAQAYAGHQFGGFVPQLGDGRALLLGEVVDQNSVRRDIQLKGSGRTPFSRGGDGKSALGPVIREYIVSESMHALGVPTTRALAAVTTGETVLRQEGSLAGGIFTRVASSHIRVGTFQYFYAKNDHDALRELADYTIARHYTESADAEEPYIALLERVLEAQAKLIPHWMSLGFIHGVMNTDNTAISGETIDYGPCAFMEEFHPNCVFSSIDRNARYAWGAQPNMAEWNLTRFAETLLSLISNDSETALEKAKTTLAKFRPLFRAEYDNRFRAKFGLNEEASLDIVRSGLSLLSKQEIDFTLFFRHLAYGDLDALNGLFQDREALEDWLNIWKQATPNPEVMKKANPVFIPRNHRVEQAIQAAYKGHYEPFHKMVDAMAHPYEENSAYSEFEKTPLPEEVVHQTFCGT